MTDELAPHWLQVAHPPAGEPGFTVHAPSLKEVADGLRADLDRHYAGAGQVIQDKVNQVVGAPVHAGWEVSLARLRLRTQLAECVAGLTEHAQAGYRLARVAAEVSARYGDTDVYAAARVTDVASLRPPVTNGPVQ